MVRDLVDDVVLVSEGAIARAMRFAFVHDRQVLEGAGAVGIAAVLEGRLAGSAGPVAVVCSGGNIGAERFLGIIAEAARERGEDGE
ncbi:MAG: hypothetical protein P8Z81_12910 [Deinococcales bacterium]